LGQILSGLNDNAVFAVSEHGFALGIAIAGEAELYRTAILPEFRRRGEGLRLLSAFLEACAARDCRSVFLEVRSRNNAAISLYKAAGFEQVGMRRGYYGDDDGVVMKLIIANNKPSAE
jgi:ribosomal-protein-alanine N-acetyltransferase